MKRGLLFTPKAVFAWGIERGPVTPFCQFCLFPGSYSGCSIDCFQRSGLQGQYWPWRSRACPRPGASGSLPVFWKQVPSIRGTSKVLLEWRVSGEWQRVCPTLRSREKQERPPLPRSQRSEQRGRSCVRVGAGVLSPGGESPAAWGVEARLCLAGTYCPGSYGLKNP